MPQVRAPSPLAAHALAAYRAGDHQPQPDNTIQQAIARFRGDWNCLRWQVFGLGSVGAFTPAELWSQAQIVAGVYQRVHGVKFLALPASNPVAVLKWLGELGN